MFCPFNILRYKFGVEYLKRSQKRQIQPAQKYFSPFRLIGIFSQLTPNRLFCLIEIVKNLLLNWENKKENNLSLSRMKEQVGVKRKPLGPVNSKQPISLLS